MTQPGYLQKLTELGGAVGQLESGEVVGRMPINGIGRGSPENEWQFRINRRTGCWDWVRATDDGYGVLRIVGENRAHRVYYKLLKSKDILDRLLDHLCRNRACVNPDHLRIATNRENVLSGIGITARNARKTHCSRGHEFDRFTTASNGYPRRHCQVCKNMMQRTRRKHEQALP